MRSGSCATERGTAVVEFLGAAVLLILGLLLVVQLAVWVWARDVAVTAVHEGARTAAESGRGIPDGVTRTRTLLHDGLGAAGARFDVDAAEEGDEVVVRARGTAPVVVPFLPRWTVDARAVAFDEDRVLP